jgi:hypothetical protein
MSTEIKFEGFKKIPRLSKEMVITEKLDGTNGLIQITHNGEFFVGSKSRWLKVDGSKATDNYGFGKWALENKEELLKLGTGKHFGEWVGLGINKRNYNLTDKKFVLFDVHKWNNENKPVCCEVVPVLYTGAFCTEKIKEVMNDLKVNGSKFSKNYMNPEGIIIYHTASKQLYKKTFDYDETGKEAN